MLIKSSDVALYSGSELVNALAELGYVNGNIVAKSQITSDFISSGPIIASVEQTVENFPIIFKSEVRSIIYRDTDLVSDYGLI